jgi:thymidylate kinase
MVSVALIGPDGAGKTTVSKQLEHAFPMPVKYVYMGINPDASNHMLPTTRLLIQMKRMLGRSTAKGGPRDPKDSQTRRRGKGKRLLYGLKTGLSLTNRIAEEWFRQGLAWYYQQRGYLVLFDRHYFSDYYSYDVMTADQPRALSRRIHGFMLNRVYPKPHLVIYLDAPAEVLFARKGEGSVSLLEERRKAYLQMASLVPAFRVVDATQTIDEVTQETQRIILQYCRQKAPAMKGLSDVSQA